MESTVLQWHNPISPYPYNKEYFALNFSHFIQFLTEPFFLNTVEMSCTRQILYKKDCKVCKFYTPKGGIVHKIIMTSIDTFLTLNTHSIHMATLRVMLIIQIGAKLV
jgi:hypothetical protein